MIPSSVNNHKGKDKVKKMPLQSLSPESRAVVLEYWLDTTATREPRWVAILREWTARPREEPATSWNLLFCQLCELRPTTQPLPDSVSQSFCKKLTVYTTVSQFQIQLPPDH